MRGLQPVQRWVKVAVASVALAAACACEKRPPQQTVELLKAQDLQILPFTAVADWTFDGQADGLMAFVRPVDNFNDPNKAVGDFLVELYTFRDASTDRRGERIGFWVVTIDTKDRQAEYWDPVTLCYRFQLAYVQPVAVGRKYVLSVIYNSPFRDRLFAQSIFEVRAEPGGTRPMIVNSPTTKLLP